MTPDPPDRRAAWTAFADEVRARLRVEHDRAARRRLWRALSEAIRTLARLEDRPDTAVAETALDRVFGPEDAGRPPTLEEVLKRPDPDAGQLVNRGPSSDRPSNRRPPRRAAGRPGDADPAP